MKPIPPRPHQQTCLCHKCTVEVLEALIAEGKAERKVVKGTTYYRAIITKNQN